MSWSGKEVRWFALVSIALCQIWEKSEERMKYRCSMILRRVSKGACQKLRRWKWKSGQFVNRSARTSRSYRSGPRNSRDATPSFKERVHSPSPPRNTGHNSTIFEGAPRMNFLSPMCAAWRVWPFPPRVCHQNWCWGLLNNLSAFYDLPSISVEISLCLDPPWRHQIPLTPGTRLCTNMPVVQSCTPSFTGCFLFKDDIALFPFRSLDDLSRIFLNVAALMEQLGDHPNQ